MLIIQIALGIVLGFIILAYLPQLLLLSGWVILGGILVVALILAVAFFKPILMFASIPVVLALGYAGGIGIYMLVSIIYPKIKQTITTVETWSGTFAIFNFLLVLGILDTLPFFLIIRTWSFKNGFQDTMELIVAGAFCMWAWIPTLMIYYIKRKKTQRTPDTIS